MQQNHGWDSLLNGEICKKMKKTCAQTDGSAVNLQVVTSCVLQDLLAFWLMCQNKFTNS